MIRDKVPTFALIGAGGYIAPRHMKAVRDIGGRLIAALDPADSVGILDSYFPDAKFFTEFERFDRFVDVQNRSGDRLDYISICSPNYLHDAHSRFALRNGAHAICEKPLVLNPHNIDALEDLERETGKRVYNILQLRLHAAIIALKKRIEEDKSGRIYDVDLTYITSRGAWYYASWKGDDAKSGGIATNIGVHFFDMLTFVFGSLKKATVHHRAEDSAAGYLEYDRARVRWFLSINVDDVPPAIRERQRTYRSLQMDGEEIEFSDGFTDLHTHCYRDIMSGGGFSLAEARTAIETVAVIRNAAIEWNSGEQHPFATNRKTSVSLSSVA